MTKGNNDSVSKRVRQESADATAMEAEGQVPAVTDGAAIFTLTAISVCGEGMYVNGDSSYNNIVNVSRGSHPGNNITITGECSYTDAYTGYVKQ